MGYLGFVLLLFGAASVDSCVILGGCMAVAGILLIAAEARKEEKWKRT